MWMDNLLYKFNMNESTVYRMAGYAILVVCMYVGWSDMQSKMVDAQNSVLFDRLGALYSFIACN